MPLGQIYWEGGMNVTGVRVYNGYGKEILALEQVTNDHY
jgi:hypothetical protein